MKTAMPLAVAERKTEPSRERAAITAVAAASCSAGPDDPVGRPAADGPRDEERAGVDEDDVDGADGAAAAKRPTRSVERPMRPDDERLEQAALGVPAHGRRA